VLENILALYWRQDISGKALTDAYVSVKEPADALCARQSIDAIAKNFMLRSY
jgi:hypothetical protein